MTVHQTTHHESALHFSSEQAMLRASWRNAILALVVGMGGLIALFWGTAAAAVGTWYYTASFNHAFLIVPISGYLIWERRELLARLAPRPSAVGLAIVVAAALAWLVGASAGARVVEQFALVAMIQGMVLTVLGWRVTRRMAFPLAYLVFMVPFGDFLVPKLQDVTAEFVVQGLRLIGVPVYSDGIFISIPTGNFEVAEACSGLRFMTASVALGLLFSNMMYRSWWRRGAFMLLTVTVPVVANGLRALGIVLLAYLSNNEIAIGVDHIVYGWVFFSFVTLILLALGMTFRDGGVIHKPATNLVAGTPAPAAMTAAMLAATLVLAAAAPGYAVYGENRAATSKISPSLQVPDSFGPWRVTGDGLGDWQPQFRGADSVTRLRYENAEGEAVYLVVARYKYQRDGAEAAGYGTNFESENWQRAGSGRASARVDGEDLGAAYTRLVSRQSGRIVWYWNWVDGQFTGSPQAAKLLQLRARLFGGTEAAAVVAVAADYTERPAEAGQTIQAFLDQAQNLAPILENSVTK